MNVAKSSSKIFIANIFKAAASFFAVVVFSHGLGASPLGTYYPFIAILSILAIPTNFGIRGALKKRLSEGKDPESYLGSAIAFKLVTLTAAITGIILTRDYLNTYLGADLSGLLIVAIVLFELRKTAMYVLHGELRVGESAVVKILQPLGWLVFGYYFLEAGYGVYAPVYGYLAGSVLMSIGGWWRVSISIGRPTISHIKSLFQYGRYSIISHIGGYFYSWMDVAILSAFVAAGIASTRAEIGAYENAWRLSLVATMASRAIANALFPQISQWDANGMSEKIESAIHYAILPSMLLVIPIFAGTMVLSENLLSIIFGPEFTVASTVLVILMGEKILQSVHTVFVSSLQAIDRPDLAAYATAASVVVNLVLNIVLIWRFGIVGAAIATGLALAVNTGIHTHYLRQFISIEFPARETGWSIIASGVMGLFVYLIKSVYAVPSALDLFAVIFTGALIYVSLMLFSESVRNIIRQDVLPLVSAHNR